LIFIVIKYTIIQIFASERDFLDKKKETCEARNNVEERIELSHLITTSKNLFQSAGLNLLRHIASPLISFTNLFSISSS
jgi:hypothetical protein